ncbi:MAG: hypothetical protein PHD10_02745 [Bacilli bacterium]|nr:hypothetical protein [Bacilli bacterium]MDD4608030.1 hypothetical protein [Bacilli bacterium]
MKKKNIIILTIILLIGIFIGLKYIPFGTTKYNMPNSNVELKVPKLSSFEEECCMFSATFKSFRSKSSLQRELDKIMNSYEKKICNNRTIYYNEKQDITITEYGVKRGILLNTFYVTYDKGSYENNECSVITDSIKLKYQIDYDFKNKRGFCRIPEKFKYLNRNGETYDVYYECFGDLLFKTGMDKMEYLNYMLSSGWISMHDVIDFLEYQVINGEATKNEFKDGGLVIYKNKDYSLLKCNNWTGNQDIYIGGTNFEYKESYCK